MIRSGAPSAVRAGRSPKRFWLWSKYGLSGPFPAPGHANPRPSHISLLFSWLQNASGYQRRWGAFFPLIFTHKMCISRTKAAMMGPLVLDNFFSILSRNSCTVSPSRTKMYNFSFKNKLRFFFCFFFQLLVSGFFVSPIGVNNSSA